MRDLRDCWRSAFEAAGIVIACDRTLDCCQNGRCRLNAVYAVLHGKVGTALNEISGLAQVQILLPRPANASTLRSERRPRVVDRAPCFGLNIDVDGVAQSLAARGAYHRSHRRILPGLSGLLTSNCSASTSAALALAPWGISFPTFQGDLFLQLKERHRISPFVFNPHSRPAKPHKVPHTL